jgi:peroxiredoxin
MKQRWPLLLLIAILFAGIGVYVGVNRYSPSPAAGDGSARFFALALPDASGSTIPMSQYRGKPVLVNFWATWCPPCVDEMPELNALQQEFGTRKLQIVGIGIDSAANIAEFAKKQKIDYPLVVGGASGTDLSRQLGNKSGGLPFTVLIDSNGKLSKHYLGRVKIDELRRDLLAL